MSLNPASGAINGTAPGGFNLNGLKILSDGRLQLVDGSIVDKHTHGGVEPVAAVQHHSEDDMRYRREDDDGDYTFGQGDDTGWLTPRGCRAGHKNSLSALVRTVVSGHHRRYAMDSVRSG